MDDVNPLYGYNNHSDNGVTTLRLGANYALTPHIGVFAGYGQGVRVPTFAVYVEPPQAQRSAQKELGLRLIKLNGLSATLAWFDLRLNHVTVPTPNPNNDPSLVGTSIQDGEQRSTGLDLDLNWQLSPQWRWQAAWSHLSAEETGGLQRFNLPTTTARLATRYEFAGGSALHGLGLGAGLTHHSRLAGDAANSFFTPAVTVADVQASYRLNPAFSLGLLVNNLTDKAYFEPMQYFGGGQVAPAPRRSLALTARADF